ncbi:MAG: aspartate carbamoyltransferase catalytic subunit [Chloroflexi bacterium]|nr:aspartate carbamoyltransferase catalytic subunit [Chloroflexota bacterium]MYF21774.1 aspartate carbamoyltransferase catalytic subunit [Chloroflexota bacterium]
MRRGCPVVAEPLDTQSLDAAGPAPPISEADRSPARAPFDDLASDWRLRHLLDVDTLSRDEILRILSTANAMAEVLERPVARTPALRGVTVFNLFYEASTRTRSSFELAGKILGADVINVSGSGSSVEKGESLVETLNTLAAVGADAVVMRHPASGAPWLAARTIDGHIINAGDGQHAHPTQALLDAYILLREFGDLGGRRIVIVGDILHSRVARSNIWSLTKLGAEVTVVAPRPLLPASMTAGAAEKEHPLSLPNVRVESDLDEAIVGADAVMALRIQGERLSGKLLPSSAEYARRYQLTAERVAQAAPHAIVMHPGPMNEGVEIAVDVAHSSQSRIEAQVSAGLAVRMAVLFLLIRGGA